MQQWVGYSAPARAAALHDIPMLREFAGLDAGEDVMPDAATLLEWRRLLETHPLAQTLLDETAALPAERGPLLRQGALVDAALSAAPPLTKNRERQRGGGMSSTPKGNNSPFGLKAHIGVAADSGPVQAVAVTAAEVADGTMTDARLHGEERGVLGDRAYTRNDRNPEAERGAGEPVRAFPLKRQKGGDLPAEHTLHHRLLAGLRAVVAPLPDRQPPVWVCHGPLSGPVQDWPTTRTCCLPPAISITCGRR
jgi:IS5 family transposase